MATTKKRAYAQQLHGRVRRWVDDAGHGRGRAVRTRFCGVKEARHLAVHGATQVRPTIAARERRSDRWRVQRSGDRIKMEVVAPKIEKTPAAKREAKGLPPIVKRKNGKATGRKVAKTTENGRQAVESVAEPVTATEAV